MNCYYFICFTERALYYFLWKNKSGISVKWFGNQWSSGHNIGGLLFCFRKNQRATVFEQKQQRQPWACCLCVQRPLQKLRALGSVLYLPGVHREFRECISIPGHRLSLGFLWLCVGYVKTTQQKRSLLQPSGSTCNMPSVSIPISSQQLPACQSHRDRASVTCWPFSTFWEPNITHSKINWMCMVSLTLALQDGEKGQTAPYH